MLFFICGKSYASKNEMLMRLQKSIVILYDAIIRDGSFILKKLHSFFYKKTKGQICFYGGRQDTAWGNV